MANQNEKALQLNLNNEEEAEMKKEAYEQNQTYSFKMGKIKLLWQWSENEHGLIILNKEGKQLYAATWESAVRGIKGLGEYLKLQADKLIKIVVDALSVSWEKAKSVYQKLLSLFGKDQDVQIAEEDTGQGEYMPASTIS